MDISREGRKLIFWGVGEVCKNCLLYHPDVTPEFFVDSFSKQEMFEGKKIVNPNEIINWKEYFVVITIDRYSAVKDVLTSYGLEENTDFCHYLLFFDKESVTAEYILNDVLRVNEHKDVKKETLLMFMCMFIGRQSKQLQNFFNRYIKEHSSKYNIIMVANLGSLDIKSAERILGCSVVESSLIFTKTELLETRMNELSDVEKDYVKGVMIRKNIRLTDENVRNEESRFTLLKMYIEGINPNKLLIWGGWSAETYYYLQIAQKLGIEYRVLEHGSIPGTIQADPKGIMGQSIYGKDDTVLKDITVPCDYKYQFDKIKGLIINKEMDTRVFTRTVADEKQLEKLNPNKKTVFLVGMDENGMAINKDDVYWESYVSNTYHSMQEVVNELSIICSNEDYNFIYKPHPGNHLSEEFLKDKNVIYVEDMSIDWLIKKSDLVISMSSAVEFKALLYEKSLIQIGFSSLWNKGCSYCLTNCDELERLVVAAIKEGMTEKQKNNYSLFISKLLCKYFWDDLSERELRYGLTVEKDFFD